MTTSLNMNAPGYDLLATDRAKQHASWAVYWLGESLWYEMIDDKEWADRHAEAANKAARVVYGLRAAAASIPLLIAAELN